MITVSSNLAKRMKESWWDKKCVGKRYTKSFDWTPIGNPNVIFNLDIEDSLCEWHEAPTAQEILDELPLWVWFTYFRNTVRMKAYKMVEPKNWDNNCCESLPFDLEWETMAEALWELWLRCRAEWYLDSNNT